MQKVAYNWICGIRAVPEGLLIDPCIPSAWKGFRAKRLYRNSSYYITVKNPRRVSHGVREMRVNGVRVEGNIIVPPRKKGRYDVVVIMGERE